MNDKSKINYYRDLIKFDKYRKFRKALYNKIKDSKYNKTKYDYGEGYFY